MPKALIIGGGVAGPAAALFLQKAGWRSELFEARPHPDSHGGLFLNVATNGLAVLDQLGLRERVVALGHPCPYLEMWSGRDRLLGTVPNGPAGEPERGSVVVRRDHLHDVLREGMSENGLSTTWGARLMGIEEHADGVTAHFADGSQATGDILIGCDGVGSVTRRWIDPAAPEPQYTSLLSVGGFSRVPGLEPTPGRQRMIFGARGFFGYLVRDDGEVYWFANPRHPEVERDELRRTPTTTWLAELRELHAEDPHPVPQILAAADEVGAYAIYDLPHVPRWHRGRVVALGDAVHATSPNAGQGASLALEDAAALARSLRDEPGFAQAFSTYERLRRPRAEQVVAYSRAIGRQKTTSGSRLAVALRDLMLPLFLRNATKNTRNNHLYNHTIPWDDPTPVG